MGTTGCFLHDSIVNPKLGGDTSVVSTMFPEPPAYAEYPEILWQCEMLGMKPEVGTERAGRGDSPRINGVDISTQHRRQTGGTAAY